MLWLRILSGRKFDTDWHTEGANVQTHLFEVGISADPRTPTGIRIPAPLPESIHGTARLASLDSGRGAGISRAIPTERRYFSL